MTELNETVVPDFSPAIYRERGFLKYDDGRIHAELQESPAGALEIWDWLSMYERRGHSAAALAWLKEQGYSKINIIDATEDALPFWTAMHDKGLVDSIAPASFCSPALTL